MAEPRRAPVFDRVERDLARGDLGSARRRLESHARSQPYDPDLLSRIGELALKMGDPVIAGRAFLLSSASGPEVEAAVDAFVRAQGRDSRAIAAWLRAMPRVVALPEEVWARLERHGIELGSREVIPDRLRTTRRTRAFAVGCVVLTVAIAAVFLAGVVHLIRSFAR